MKLPLNQEIMDMEGLPVRIKDGDSEKPLTLQKCIIEALLTPLRGDDTLDADKKLTFYTVAIMVRKEENPNFTPEEIVLIKERISKRWSPLIMGRAYDLIKEMDG